MDSYANVQKNMCSETPPATCGATNPACKGKTCRLLPRKFLFMSPSNMSAPNRSFYPGTGTSYAESGLLMALKYLGSFHINYL